MFKALFLLNLCLTISTFSGDKSTRLIGNDPDVILERLNHLESKVAILTAENQQYKTQIQDLETKINGQRSSGSTYVIWGRKQCPNNSHTEQVYSGFAGGSYYNHAGAAAEYVCLPPDPIFTKSGGIDGGRMYGAEYESGNYWGTNAVNEDVPCALCRLTDVTSIIMISGRNKCYPGWTMEYHGNLAAGAYGHTAASQYVCVDNNPEYLNAGVTDSDGKLFYPVVAKCGSLQCPPYIDGYPLTCAVCSK